MKAGGGLLSEYSIGDPERRRLKLKHTWNWFVTTAGRSQAVQINRDGACVASGSGPCINDTHKWQKFSS